MPHFPSLKARELERVLLRAPLNYRCGPPDRVTSPFSYHGGSTFPPGVVRKILVKEVGLTEEQALKLLGKETS